jgi:ABC-type transport system substrate-binding protein
MAFDDDEAIRVLDNGFAGVRHQVVPPGIEGHLPGYRNPNMHNRDGANALLDRFGYRRAADGWRRNPDGTALAIGLLADPRTHERRRAEFIKRMMDRIGVRVTIDVVQPLEYLKRRAQCRYTMAWADWQLDIPDGTDLLGIFYGRNVGSGNVPCFVDADFDSAYERALNTVPGPARNELFRTMQGRIDAYAPARPMPRGDLLFLKRAAVLGPFGTMSDWLQAVTLARVAAPVSPARP